MERTPESILQKLYNKTLVKLNTMMEENNDDFNELVDMQEYEKAGKIAEIQKAAYEMATKCELDLKDFRTRDDIRGYKNTAIEFLRDYPTN